MRKVTSVTEVEVSTVVGNKTLAAGVDRRSIERCKEAIGALGVLHTPIVGTAEGGKRLVLSGQCELTALRELGVKKMDAVEVDVLGEDKPASMLSLLLLSLRDKPGALTEGQLLQEAVGAGAARSEIQTMLGKSASWVSNRLSLVTRLDKNVYELVGSGLLDPRSAQEVARLPAPAQFKFAEAAVREGLPKSAIESLVAGYNDEGCPDAVRKQILSDPRAALKRVSDRRRAVARPHRNGGGAEAIEMRVESVISQVAMLRRLLGGASPNEADGCVDTLRDLETELSVLLTGIRKFISPGKEKEAKNV